jgi:hypothetical protein
MVLFISMNDHESSESRLLARRRKLAAVAQDFTRKYDIDDFTEDELNHWIEELRPVRMEICRIDDQLWEIDQREGVL